MHKHTCLYCKKEWQCYGTLYYEDTDCQWFPELACEECNAEFLKEVKKKAKSKHTDTERLSWLLKFLDDETIIKLSRDDIDQLLDKKDTIQNLAWKRFKAQEENKT